MCRKNGECKGIRCSTVETKVRLAKRTIKACLLVAPSGRKGGLSKQRSWCAVQAPQPLKILKSQQKRNTEPSPAVDADGVVDDALKENGTGGESVNPRPRVVGEEKVGPAPFTYRAGPCECDSTLSHLASHTRLRYLLLV
jgi:hypothetical protein